MDLPGSPWISLISLDPLLPFQTYLDCLGPTQTFSQFYQFYPLGTTWSCLVLLRPTWSQLEPIGPVWTHLDVFRCVRMRVEAFWRFRIFFEIYRKSRAKGLTILALLRAGGLTIYGGSQFLSQKRCRCRRTSTYVDVRPSVVRPFGRKIKSIISEKALRSLFS